MVIYEVNLEINADIYAEYYQWLLEHVKAMLRFTGFKKAELGQVVDQAETNLKNIRISYLIDTYEDLQNYFSEHAVSMRLDGVKRFGNGFRATRRIIVDPIIMQ